MGRQTFKESDLIKKARDINLGRNYRNVFQKECYCTANDYYHIKDTLFDSARSTRLATTYFGSKNESEYCLNTHTKPFEQACFLKTCYSVTSNIQKLHRLGERNWSRSDIREDKHISTLSCKKPQVTVKTAPDTKLPRCQSQRDCPMASTQCQLAGTFNQKKFPSTARKLVRVFSPQVKCYIQRPAYEENESQKLAYASMKNANNMHSIEICGTKGGLASTRPFDKIKACYQTAKPYTVSAETFHSSWVDAARVKATTNYESSNFNIINHGRGYNTSVAKLIQDNPKACYKVKSIAEYSDLTRVTAPKKSREYQIALNSIPNCFKKSTSLCSKQLDVGKTYGPFYKIFH